MKEIFLEYIWTYQRFKNNNLTTTNQQSIEIYNQGLKNIDAGPDFFNAKIKINDVIWVGNIEIHINSSDWFKHNHQMDKNYNKIILHVVWNDDIDFFEKTKIPTLELKYLVPKIIIKKYYDLCDRTDIPCGNNIKNIDKYIIDQCINRMVIERLQIKSKEIISLYQYTNKDWAETFYIALAKNFGFKTNSLPFELLAKSLPLNIIFKHKDNIVQIESLLFGQAGMLEKSFKEQYPKTLQKEYKFLKQKYNLQQTINDNVWKFSKTRPGNFPTIRIAQFSMLLHKSEQLFIKIIKNHTVKQLKKYFLYQPSNYWKYHYNFEGKITVNQKTIGESSIDNIIINTVLPLLYSYGEYNQNEKYKEIGIELMLELPAEKNNVIKKWSNLELKIKNAMDSQGLIQLKNEYCNKKKCLQCQIGNQILR